LIKLVDPGKIDDLLSVASDIADYLEFKTVLDLGLQIHHSELPFEKVLIFSWIKEGIENGREHRVSAQGNRR
jgi:hypothetical protein